MSALPALRSEPELLIESTHPDRRLLAGRPNQGRFLLRFDEGAPLPVVVYDDMAQEIARFAAPVDAAAFIQAMNTVTFGTLSLPAPLFAKSHDR